MDDGGQAGIVGRDWELRTLDRFLQGAVEESPVAVAVLEGEAGIGKTTVWLEAIERARDRGFRVLSARAAQGEAKLAYTSVADLFGGVFDEVRAALPPPQERALAAALLREDGDESIDPRATATAVTTTVAELAAGSPVILAVDDVQWLDRASERALEFAVRRLPVRVAVLLTRRLERDVAVPEIFTSIGPGRFVRVSLGALSLAALHHILRDRLDEAPTRSTLVRVHAASAGNPFYALEIVKTIGFLSDALPVPTEFERLLAARLRRLAPEVGEALLAAAALSRPTGELVDVTALAPAEDAGIVRVTPGGSVEFSHPLFAAAVYASASASRRRALHAALAPRVADPEERARHLALAMTAPDEEVASALVRGAASARARGALDAAGELLESAARLTPSTSAGIAQRRVVDAAEAFFHAGDARRAASLLERVLAEAPERNLRGRALRLLGEMRYQADGFPAAIELLERALEDVDDAAVAVPLMLDLSFALVSSAQFERARNYASAAVARAEDARPRALLGEALAVRVIVDFMSGAGLDEDGLARALELEDPTRRLRLLMRPTAIAAQLAFHGDDFVDARRKLRLLRDQALARGEESELPFLLLYLAGIEWRTGRYDEAIAVVEDTLRIIDLTGATTMRAVALVHRAMARTFLGDVDAARADIAASRLAIEETGWSLALVWAAMAAGFLAVTIGDYEEALRELDPLARDLETTPVADPLFAWFAPDAVEALVATGQVERASRVLDSFDTSARRAGRRWALAESLRLRALVEAARGDVDAALASIESSLEHSAQIEMPFGIARAHLVRGSIHRRRREKRLAREAYACAMMGFEQLGAVPWVEKAERELKRVTPKTGSLELTETERRVAELAASGRTNREVAQLIHVSTKTVETHLGHAYTKLGIRSRAELGARMAQRRETPDSAASSKA